LSGRKWIASESLSKPVGRCGFEKKKKKTGKSASLENGDGAWGRAGWGKRGNIAFLKIENRKRQREGKSGDGGITVLRSKNLGTQGGHEGRAGAACL